MTSNLSGQTALITGASSGIGAAIARALGACGVEIGLVGRRADALEAVCRDLKGPSRAPKMYTFDLSLESEVQVLAEKMQEDFGGADILVHGAGIFVEDCSEDNLEGGFDHQYGVNLRAPYALTRAMIPSLRERRGQVVFLNSSAARNARSGVGQYAATKAALKAVADAFRCELNEDGVRVLSVFIGRTATPMQEAIFAREGRDYQPDRLLQPSDVASVVAHCLSLPRTAEVTELDIRPMMKS